MDMYLRLKYRTKSIEEIINKSKLGDDEHRYRKKIINELNLEDNKYEHRKKHRKNSK